jgi:hypothetical protein
MEEVGLNTLEIGQVLAACSLVVTDVPESSSKSNARTSTGGDTVSSSSAASLTTGTIFATEVVVGSSGGGGSSRNAQLKGDWLRFVTFARLCLIQLLDGGKRSRLIGD